MGNRFCCCIDEDNDVRLSQPPSPALTASLDHGNGKEEDYLKAPLFSLKGQVYHEVFVTDVYDGDTITVAFQLCPTIGIRRFKVRLNGIDTPELKPPKAMEAALRKRHIDRAKEARDVVRNLILHQYVTLYTDDFDKYGRVLAKVYVNDDVPDLSRWMLKNGYALPYDGKTKLEFDI